MEDERLASAAASELVAWNRRAIQRDRCHMLSMIPFLAEGEVCAEARADPSAVFTVHHADEKLFPRFQFADDGRPYPELKVILERLPDRRGWDRLAWFLSPHESLAGASPLEVWRQDRQRVVEASSVEHWGERL